MDPKRRDKTVKIVNQKTTTAWFENWAKEYDTTLGKADRHHCLLERAVELSKVKAGDKVLDIGCGTGLLSLKLLRKADCAVTGIDISPEMLAVFRRKIKGTSLARKIACQVGDAAALPFAANTFDVAASTVTLHHLKDKYPAVKRIFKVLKPGGRLVIGDIDLDSTGAIHDSARIKRMMRFIGEELILVASQGGPEAVGRMFDNCRKHFFNEGEYCVSMAQWATVCRRAGFDGIKISAVSGAKWFKVLTAVKPVL